MIIDTRHKVVKTKDNIINTSPVIFSSTVDKAYAGRSYF